MIGSERDTYDIDKLIGYIQQDIQSFRRREKRSEDDRILAWVEGVLSGLAFALDHALELREND